MKNEIIRTNLTEREFENLAKYSAKNGKKIAQQMRIFIKQIIKEKRKINQEKRTESIHIRISDSDKKELQKLASENSVTLSTYLEKCISDIINEEDLK